MFRNKVLTLLYPLFGIILLLPAASRADSFDDAVTHYLKGFESCKEAKSHLGANRLGDAKAALGKYNRMLEEASRIDSQILTANRRGMDGNLKYCQRVARDVEVELGMPLMDKALAQCEAAQQALKDEKPDQASARLENFNSLKAEALALAPSLGDIYSIKNQIGRCERIDRKIASFSQKQEALTLALEAVREDSASYLASCQKTLEALQRDKVDDPVLREASRGLANAGSHKTNVAGEKLAQQAFTENPAHPLKKIVDANLRQGDQCMADLTQAIARKTQELNGIRNQFARYNEELKTAGATCQRARQTTTATAAESTYANARTGYEAALLSRNSVRDSLARDSHYRTYEGWENVRTIEQHMLALNRCLDDTRSGLGAMFAALSASSAAAPVAAPAAATSAPASVTTAPASAAPAATDTAAPSVSIARTIKGTVRMMNLAPEFALFYVADGTRPQSGDIVIDRAGFEALLYVTSGGDSLSLKNKDNTTHRITASNDRIDLVENLARLQPRQNRTAKVTWPDHTIVTLRSDRGALAASYVANVPSAHYQQLSFSNSQSSFSFNNETASPNAYLIMPDTDVLTFILNKGETKSLAITRNGEPVGSLLVTGE